MQKLSGLTKRDEWIVASYLVLFLCGTIFCGTMSAQAAPGNGPSGQLQPAPASESRAQTKPAAIGEASAHAVGGEHPDLPISALKPKVIEDWSTPSLKGSDLKLGDVLNAGIDTHNPTFTRELVRVEWRAGDPIDLYIIKPKVVEKPPVILYLYSYPFETDGYLKNDFAAFLAQNGFAAVGFASALTSGRYHAPRPLKEWFVSELQESLATTAHDVQMILNYLGTRHDMDMDRVGMFGDGSGATIAILAAAVDPRIKTLDLLNPWGDWPDWLAKSPLVPEKERPDYVKPEFLGKVAPLDPAKWLPELKTQKIRLQLVNGVGVTPNVVREKIEAAAPASAEIVHFESVEEFSRAAASGTRFNWIKEKLQPGSTRRQTPINAGLPSNSSVKAAQ